MLTFSSFFRNFRRQREKYCRNVYSDVVALAKCLDTFNQTHSESVSFVGVDWFGGGPQ